MIDLSIVFMAILVKSTTKIVMAATEKNPPVAVE
jgi:hypothetical protein